MALKFVNIGENPLVNPAAIWVGRRQWNACVEYNFVSAGQDPKYSKQLFRLHPGDIFAAYSTGRGYLGIGRVCETPIQIREFSFNGQYLADFDINPDIINGKLITADTVNNMQFLRQTLFCNALNINSEFGVKVKWLETVPHEQAKWRQGLFAKQHIVCSMAKQTDTINFLSREFDIDLN